MSAKKYLEFISQKSTGKIKVAPKELRTFRGKFNGEYREIVFDSEGEMKRFNELLILQRAGKITDLEIQKRYLLQEKQKDERAIYYVADFFYFENDKPIAEDFKSKFTRKLKTYVIKRKLFKKRYPDIEFRESMKGV